MKDNEPYSWETYSPKDGGTKKSEYIPFLLMWALSWGYSLAYMPTEAGSNFVIISAMLYWGTKLPLQHMNR